MSDTDLQYVRDWLMQLDNLSMVRRCRALIRDEFGVTIHLNAPDILEDIDHHAARARNPELRALGQRIHRFLVTRPKNATSDFALAHIPVVAARPVRGGWGLR
jgi:hypothetical protein